MFFSILLFFVIFNWNIILKSIQFHYLEHNNCHFNVTFAITTFHSRFSRKHNSSHSVRWKFILLFCTLNCNSTADVHCLISLFISITACTKQFGQNYFEHFWWWHIHRNNCVLLFSLAKQLANVVRFSLSCLNSPTIFFFNFSNISLNQILTVMCPFRPRPVTKCICHPCQWACMIWLVLFSFFGFPCVLIFNQ